MYTDPKLLESIKKVEATRAERLKMDLTKMRMTAEQKDYKVLCRLTGTERINREHEDPTTCSNYIRWKWKMGKKQRNAKKLRTYGRG